MRNKDFYSLDRWHKPFLENSYVKTVGLGLLLSCAGSPFTMAAIPPPYVDAVAIVQQNAQITGTVVDEKGEPLIGVAVQVKGTSRGTVTNLDGQFTLDVKERDMLEFSYIGYTTQTLKASPVMKIVMKEDAQKLNEVVVVGYGSTTKRDLIASVSTVKADQISNVPVANLTQGLAGRSPGLIVQASGGGVNSKPNVSIRGGGEPIYVIDGIIRSANDFANLAPDDIESMSILKDASATAVYGSRATNGIIQVVTKQGKAGKTSIEYDFSYSIAQPSIWDKKLSAYDRAIWSNTAKHNDGLPDTYDAKALEAFRTGSDPLNFANTDWRKLVLNNWAPQQKHAIRVFGGNETNRYYVSLGHIDQNSLYKNDNHWMKRTTFRLAQSTNLKPLGLQINATIDGYREHTTHPYTSSAEGYYQVFSHINDKMPNIPGYNQFGLPYQTNDNPVSETAEDAGYNRTISNVINGKGEIIWTVPWVKGLKVRASSNYRYYSNSTKKFRKDAAKYAWDSTEPSYDSKPLLRYENSNGYAFTNQAFVEYANQFGKHSVSALAGFEQYYEKNEGYFLGRRDFLFDIDQIIVGDSNTQTNGGILEEKDAYGNKKIGAETELGRAAWIGQIKYNYANKYYAEASIRYDGSDRFAKGNRWGAFFSGSLGWVVTEENFMKSLVEKDILNSLKLRLSYGQTGLDESAGRYAYMTTYNFNAQSYVVDGSFKPGFTEGPLASPDLTWYTTKQFDMGFDFASLQNRLYGSFDYFYYSTTGYLTAPTGQSYLNVALGTGMPKIKSNSELRRAGYEVQLGWRDNIGDFKYDVSGNFTFFDELWALDEGESEVTRMNPYKRRQQNKGYFIYDDNLYYLYKNLGYYQSAQDVYNSPAFINSMNSGYLTAGDIKYADLNGDGRITDEDQRRLGKAKKPRGQYGINLNMSYKGFYLSMLFQGSTAFDMYISDGLAMKTGQTSSMPLAYDHQIDHWRPDNRHAQYPRLMSNTGLNQNNNYQRSDFWLLNGAYLRMKDLQFGYDFKHRLLKQVNWLTRAKVGISCQNLFTISEATKYGLDPENSSTENYGYPVERTIAFTLNLGF